LRYTKWEVIPIVSVKSIEEVMFYTLYPVKGSNSNELIAGLVPLIKGIREKTEIATKASIFRIGNNMIMGKEI